METSLLMKISIVEPKNDVKFSGFGNSFENHLIHGICLTFYNPCVRVVGDGGGPPERNPGGIS
jgi:hypothetical protein